MFMRTSVYKPVLAILLVLLPLCCFAQNQKLIDSLETTLRQHTKEDTSLVNNLNDLAFEYRSFNKEKAIALLDRSVRLSRKLNFLPGLALAYNHIGIIFKNERQFDSAIHYHRLALGLRTKLHDTRGMASSYNNIGLTYDTRQDYTNAMNWYIRSLRQREQNNDTPGAAAAYINISQIYAKKRDFRKAVEYASRSLDLRARIGDSFEVARNASTLGFMWYEQNQFDKALALYKRSMKIFEEVGAQIELAGLMNNIGNLLGETGKLDSGIYYHEQALTIQKANGHGPGMYTSLLSLGQAYAIKGKFALAEKYCTEALAVLEQIGGNAKMFMDAYQVTAELYRAQGKYEKAYSAFNEYNRYKDTLIQQNNSKIVSELQEQYETQKKDLAIATKDIELKKADYEIRKRQMISFILVGAIVMLLVIGYLLYNRYKLRKQKEIDAEIIRQQEIKSKAIIEAEEKERVRIAKDLHDGVGQQLAAVKLNLSSLEDSITTDPAKRDQYAAMMKMMDDAVKELRGVSHNMMPNALLRKGLAVAVREFIDNIAATGALKIDLQIVGMSNRLDSTIEMVLYRVLQEGVSNIIKHAGASAVTIELIRHDSYLSMLLEDNGKGFEVSAVQDVSGIGLKNMLSRVEYLNGTLNFDSSPGKGTTVIVEVPLT